jgi:hypothetical protein
MKATLIGLGWHVEVLSCNAYQKGIPDFYCFKDCVGRLGQYHGEVHRWVDIKRPSGSKLTPDQCRKWPVWESIGLGVWILDGTEEDPEAVLFGPPNFRNWWKPAYDKYLVRNPADILRDTE